MISGRQVSPGHDGLDSSASSRLCRATSVALIALAACSTTDPVENYRWTSSGRAEDAATVGAGGSGGSPAATVSGGLSAAGTGGSSSAAAGAAGASGAEAGSTADAGSTSGSGGDVIDGGLVVDCEVPVAATPEFSKARLREAAADCALYHLCRFEAHAAYLEASVADYAASLAPEAHERAQQAWREAMAVWQQLELFQFGPLANPSLAAGKDSFQGQGIRDKIYAWPIAARCRVDEQVVGRAFVERGMDSALISGRGLYALETLLYYEGDDSACVSSTTTAKAYAALEPATLEAYKLDYAMAVAEDVVDVTRGVMKSFAPEEGNFRQQFVTAAAYPSEQEAMNVLGWALSYVEKEVKDWKLGLPAGYTLNAPVSEPEAHYAGTGHENLRANLLGFRSLFQGCGPHGEGLGFDDWLVAAGHAELAQDISVAWTGAHAVIAELPPLQRASEAELDRAYLALKVLTDLLKNELLGAGSPINLDLPSSVEGDTD